MEEAMARQQLGERRSGGLTIVADLAARDDLDPALVEEASSDV